MEKHNFHSDSEFEFEAGGRVAGLDVTYHCSKGGYKGQPVVWICHALTANSDPSDWWKDLVGPGKLIDTEKFFVVCGNMLGSCYGSSGPTSINPETGRPYLLDFPKITIRDMVRALDMVRKSIGITQIDLLIGASIGGFQAIEYSVMFPDLIKKAVYMATLARVTPWLTAFEESQRLILESDPDFRACKSVDVAKKALAAARSVAMLSYRTGDGYNRRQFEKDGETLFADKAASYQRYQGKKLADRFDAYSYWYLTYGVDSSNVGRGRGGVEAALSSIKAETTVIGIGGDLLFPSEEMAKMSAMMGGTYHEITSYFGHDGFLLEIEQISHILRPIVESL